MRRGHCLPLSQLNLKNPKPPVMSYILNEQMNELSVPNVRCMVEAQLILAISVMGYMSGIRLCWHYLPSPVTQIVLGKNIFPVQS